MTRVEKALAAGWAFGMFQHTGEIGPFAEWVEDQGVRTVLEIGSWKGGTTAIWCELTRGHYGAQVVSVDLPNGPFGGLDCGLTAEVCAERTCSSRRAGLISTACSATPATRSYRRACASC